MLLPLALLAGCAVRGYYELDDLKSEARHKVVFEIEADPVLVYRDITRSLNRCTFTDLGEMFATVNPKLDRASEAGVVSLMREGRFIARYEVARLPEGKVRVAGWWMPIAARCQPPFATASIQSTPAEIPRQDPEGKKE
ncbi:hypothetical protein VARIO8X_110176 [Burkholderiales bacterium 8X]|nr:hypothetical protein VARIO8X_110176 [Burkholderiales bacterium 8X]